MPSMETSDGTQTSPFCPIDRAFGDLRAGRMIILVDDEDRENEGDLVMAAQFVTPEAINFMLTQGRGVLCMPLTRERCEEMNLSLQTSNSTGCYVNSWPPKTRRVQVATSHSAVRSC